MRSLNRLAQYEGKVASDPKAHKHQHTNNFMS
jgi:hypothetical protein